MRVRMEVLAIQSGAQLGRPGRQVLALLGDGGMGVAGFDIETAARYKIPAVYLLFNNSGWLNPEAMKRALPFEGYSCGMLPDMRYDRIFEEQGCHGEYVTEPGQIRPALERAFSSGKTSVINVIPDTTIEPAAIGLFRRRAETGRPARTHTPDHPTKSTPMKENVPKQRIRSVTAPSWSIV